MNNEFVSSKYTAGQLNAMVKKIIKQVGEEGPDLLLKDKLSISVISEDKNEMFRCGDHIFEGAKFVNGNKVNFIESNFLHYFTYKEEVADQFIGPLEKMPLSDFLSKETEETIDEKYFVEMQAVYNQIRFVATKSTNEQWSFLVLDHGENPWFVFVTSKTGRLNIGAQPIDLTRRSICTGYDFFYYA